MIALQEQILPVTITKEISYIGESINLYLRCGCIENGNYVGGIGWVRRMYILSKCDKS